MLLAPARACRRASLARRCDGRIGEVEQRVVRRGLEPSFSGEYASFAPRNLGLVIAFLVAGASGIAVFIADSIPDPDPPMTAMALAPVEALSRNVLSLGSAKMQAPEVAVLQKTPKAGGSKSPCQENATEKLGSSCSPGKAYTPHSVQAVKRATPRNSYAHLYVQMM
jgi:hypothetical protein